MGIMKKLPVVLIVAFLSACGSGTQVRAAIEEDTDSYYDRSVVFTYRGLSGESDIKASKDGDDEVIIVTKNCPNVINFTNGDLETINVDCKYYNKKKEEVPLISFEVGNQYRFSFDLFSATYPLQYFAIAIFE
jgi:hypothetical protein